MSDGPALFEALPGARDRFPWHALGRFPTRVERWEGVASPAIDLWVKRDDESGAPYGGNKVRKLEFLLGGALARRARRVITVGTWGSHQVLATGIYGAQVGLPVEAVVCPQPLTDRVRETLLCDLACGVRLRPAASYADVPARVAAARLRRGSAWIPPGGSSPEGTLGYVSAAFELAAQVRRGECPAFDALYVPLGSSGTAAGLALGLRLAGFATRVVAVRVVARAFGNRAAARRLARATARLLGVPDTPPGDDALTVDHRFHGGAYGNASEEARRAVEIAARAGLALDTTYTGKALAALLDDAAHGLLDGRRVLFWNTFSSADLAPLLARSPGPSALPPRLRKLFP